MSDHNLLPERGRPVFVKIGRRSAWCWLAGNRRDATLYYPLGYKSANNPGISDLLTIPTDDTLIAARRCVVAATDLRWTYVRLTMVSWSKQPLYAHLQRHGCDTSKRRTN